MNARPIQTVFARKLKNKGGDDMTELYTVQQVAEKFEVHPETIRRLAKKGELPAKKIGNEWRFTEADLQAFLESAKVNPSTSTVQ